MIKKVLIAEDYESTNISVEKTLNDLQIPFFDSATYCDEALLRIKKAIQAGQSYDLLITDLYFEEDHHKVQLSGGIDLIKAVKQIQPDLKILVFSAESRPAFIKKLFVDFDIDGYVRKARGDAKELVKAIREISNHRVYKPPQLEQGKQTNTYEFTTFDTTILTLMAEGKRVLEIPDYLKEKNIIPNGKSSVEKQLKLLRETFDFSTNEQLIAHCVKMGIIG